jgi:hypothetical protein
MAVNAAETRKLPQVRQSVNLFSKPHLITLLRKTFRHLGCHCETGFVGPVCEFRGKSDPAPIWQACAPCLTARRSFFFPSFADNGEPAPPCNMTCSNNGVCRKGAKDTSVLTRFGISTPQMEELRNATHNNDFEHCVCPRGYAGLACEFEMELCPGNDHICMNGATCIPVRDSNGLHFECDCASATTPFHKYAGLYCEFESTVFCTVDGSAPSKEASSNAFCTNNGQCQALVEGGEP